MKRALAILLTFITLATGALFAPAATADGNFKTELWFTLNSDGSIKELVNVSSNDNTINADNCKGTETDIVRFTRIGKENRCIFIKYYKKVNLPLTGQYPQKVTVSILGFLTNSIIH